MQIGPPHRSATGRVSSIEGRRYGTRAEASLEIEINEAPRSAVAASEIMIRRDMTYPFTVPFTVEKTTVRVAGSQAPHGLSVQN